MLSDPAGSTLAPSLMVTAACAATAQSTESRWRSQQVRQLVKPSGIIVQKREDKTYRLRHIFLQSLANNNKTFWNSIRRKVAELGYKKL